MYFDKNKHPPRYDHNLHKQMICVMAEWSKHWSDMEPMLAYPLDEIEPDLGGITHNNSDNEQQRLQLLRCVMGLDGLYDPADKVASALHASLLEDDAEWKPHVRLNAPNTARFGIKSLDEMKAIDRARCIAVKGDNATAVRLPRKVVPAALLVVDLKRIVDIKRHNGAPVKHTNVTFCRTGSCAFGVQGSPIAPFASFQVDGVPSSLLDQLFCRSPRAACMMVPSRPGELPVGVMKHVALFWHTYVRAHVVAAACAPDRASTRPLTFDSIRVGREGAVSRVVLRAKLHPTSIECACAVHDLKPISELYPQLQLASSEVDFTLAMCGRRLQPNPASPGGFDPCPLHQGKKLSGSLVAGVCCHGTVASISCTHYTQSRKDRRRGLWIPSVSLNDTGLLAARTLLHAAVRLADKLKPVVGSSRADVVAACADDERALDKDMHEVDKQRTDHRKYSDREMTELDRAATDALRTNNVSRNVFPSNKNKEMLAIEDDGCLRPLHKSKCLPRALCDTHLGLFRPQKHKRKRA